MTNNRYEIAREYVDKLNLNYSNFECDTYKELKLRKSIPNPKAPKYTYDENLRKITDEKIRNALANRPENVDINIAFHIIHSRANGLYTQHTFSCAFIPRLIQGFKNELNTNDEYLNSLIDKLISECIHTEYLDPNSIRLPESMSLSDLELLKEACTNLDATLTHIEDTYNVDTEYLYVNLYHMECLINQLEWNNTRTY